MPDQLDTLASVEQLVTGAQSATELIADQRRKVRIAQRRIRDSRRLDVALHRDLVVWHDQGNGFRLWRLGGRLLGLALPEALYDVRHPLEVVQVRRLPHGHGGIG